MKVVDSDISNIHSFLSVGNVLSESNINNLADDQQSEIAHQINRRTEFRVLSTDFEPEVR